MPSKRTSTRDTLSHQRRPNPHIELPALSLMVYTLSRCSHKSGVTSARGSLQVCGEKEKFSHLCLRQAKHPDFCSYASGSSACRVRPHSIRVLPPRPRGVASCPGPVETACKYCKRTLHRRNSSLDRRGRIEAGSQLHKRGRVTTQGVRKRLGKEVCCRARNEGMEAS